MANRMCPVGGQSRKASDLGATSGWPVILPETQPRTIPCRFSHELTNNRTFTGLKDHPSVIRAESGPALLEINVVTQIPNRRDGTIALKTVFPVEFGKGYSACCGPRRGGAISCLTRGARACNGVYKRSPRGGQNHAQVDDSLLDE